MKYGKYTSSLNLVKWTTSLYTNKIKNARAVHNTIKHINQHTTISVLDQLTENTPTTKYLFTSALTVLN
jgi:hypothetical protein